MKLLKLYEAVLSAAGMTVSPDGCVDVTLIGKAKPATIGGKRLVLPTPEHLSNPDWTERIAFHPASENILRGESEVLAYLRNGFNVRFNYMFGILAMQLLVIATSTADHGKLSPSQSEFLSKVKNADEKTLQALEKILSAMPLKQTQKAFVSIFLKRGGSAKGKRFSRVGVVNFPLYNELKKNSSEIYGVKLRNKDNATLIALLEYMIPAVTETDKHEFGSNSTVAPFLDALMQAVRSLAGPVNDLVELFGDHLSKAEQIRIDDSWVESFEDIDALQTEARRIPMQAGNEGAADKSKNPTEASSHSHATAYTPAPAPAPTQSAPAPVATAPVAAAPKAEVENRSGIVLPSGPSFAERMAAQPAWQNPNHQQPPAHYQPAPHHNQYPGHNQHQYQPAPQAPVITSEGKLDFGALLYSNPSLGVPVDHQGRPMHPNAPYGAAPAPAPYNPSGYGSGGGGYPGHPYNQPAQYGNFGGGVGRI